MSNYLSELTSEERADLEFDLSQEKISAQVEGFQLNEDAFRKAWAEKMVVYRDTQNKPSKPKVNQLKPLTINLEYLNS